jgi:transcriptional regulator with XRE-family HTH domain
MAIRAVLSKTRLLRLGAGMRQVDLAERSGIPQPRISAFEIGKYEPTPEEQRKLDKAFNFSEGEEEGDD